MKKKIFIFALCFTLLLGVFSISASASVSYDQTNTFVFDEILNIIEYKYITTYEFISNGDSFKGISFSSNDQSISYSYLEGGSVVVYTSSGGWSNSNYRVLTHKFYNYWGRIGSGLCDYLDGYGDFVIPHTHSYTSSVIAPTHTDKGYTLYTCECGNSYQDNFVAALGHNFTITEKVDPSCTTKGYTTYICDCGYTYTEEGASYGHTFTTTTVDSTCTKKGSITYTCVSCGHSYSEILPKLEHTFVDSRCSVCNALDPSYYLDSEDNILNAWDSVFKDFFSLFGSAQSVFFDGKSLTFLGILVLLFLGLGLSFLLISVIIKFIYSRG